jgi:alanine dehydrogenase
LPLYLIEQQVIDLMNSDPLLYGAVDALESAFLASAKGEIATPQEERLRVVWPPGQDWRPYEKDIRILPAMVKTLGVAGIHLGCNAFGPNGDMTSYMILMDFDTFAPIAIIEDAAMHSVRAGAPSGIAVKLWARPDAETLGVIGSGTIADVMATVACAQRRSIKRARIFSPTPANRERFARRLSDRTGVEFEPVSSSTEAIRDADVVMIATNSYNAPVLNGDDLKLGAVVCQVTPGEMDERSVLRSRVVVTSRNRIIHDYTPWEPFTRIVRRGDLDLDAAPTLAEVLNGEAVGRRSHDEIVLLASPGIGFCDVAVAKWVYDLALKLGAGQQLERGRRVTHDQM